jgi:hypothetical protein
MIVEEEVSKIEEIEVDQALIEQRKARFAEQLSPEKISEKENAPTEN